MNKTKAERFHKLRTDELRTLARILHEEGVVQDPGPLLHAAGAAHFSRSDSGYEWGYDFHGLHFGGIDLAAARFRHSRPRSLREIHIELHLVLRGQCVDQEAVVSPFHELAVDVEIWGETEAGEILSCAWHLDRHVTTDSNPGETDLQSSHFAHPEYHFQYGGRKVWDKADAEFGTHLLLESPRIAHPPLDAVLAVDFVLSNFQGDKWKRLRKESTSYNELLLNAQGRCWRPYAMSAASHWQQFTAAKEWSPMAIWPQLL